MFLRFKLFAVASTFKRLDAGFAFYPYGAFGPGFLVDDAQRVALEARLNRFYNWAVPLLIVAVVASVPFGIKYLPRGQLGPPIAALITMAVAGVFVSLGYWLYMRPTLAGLARMGGQRTLGDIQAARAGALSYFKLCSIVAGSAIAGWGSAFALRRGIAAANFGAVVLSGLGLALFACILLVTLHTLWVKWRSR